MQDELAVGATVRRGIEGAVFGAKAGAGATNTRLGRLVLVASDQSRARGGNFVRLRGASQLLVSRALASFRCPAVANGPKTSDGPGR